MTIKEISIAAISFFLGGLSHSFIIHYVMPHAHRVYSWIFARRNHKKYGIPTKTDLVLDRDGFSLGYNFEYKGAAWAAYILTKGSVGIDVARSEAFFIDPDVPERFSKKPEDFTNSSYDKGHLAPSASIDFSEKSNLETFSMANVVPQDPKLNRQAWSRLEALEREWTYTLGKLVVYAGPIYSARPKNMNGIPIPSSFYKVIYSFKYRQYIGFILPNEPVTAKNLWSYAKTVKEVEKETGYKFFDKISGGDKKKLDVKFWEQAHV
jgi:endonuclease G, mitochondrial